MIVVDPNETSTLAGSIHCRNESLIDSLVFSPKVFAFGLARVGPQKFVIVEKRLQDFIAKLGEELNCFEVEIDGNAIHFGQFFCNLFLIF